MSNLLIKMLHEARVKEGPSGFNYYGHWSFSDETKIHKSLYNHINKAVTSLLLLPIVSLKQLKQQLPNDDYLKESILMSHTSGYNGNIFVLRLLQNILSRHSTIKKYFEHKIYNTSFTPFLTNAVKNYIICTSE